MRCEGSEGCENYVETLEEPLQEGKEFSLMHVNWIQRKVQVILETMICHGIDPSRGGDFFLAALRSPDIRI